MELQDFQAAYESSGYLFRRLDVPFAYHTQAMRPIIEEMRSFSAKIRFSAPTIPLVNRAFGNIREVESSGEVSELRMAVIR